MLAVSLLILPANECWDLPTQYQVSQGDEELKIILKLFVCKLCTFP